MCDYIFYSDNPADPTDFESRVYCERAAQFWVQATVTTHNSRACTHHLARIVREIEGASKNTIQAYKDGEEVPPTYLRWVVKDGKRLPRLFLSESHNWAYVTVKPFTRKGN